MNILVTGGAGFIGSHIAERLASDGARVKIVDIGLESRRANLDWVRGTSNVDVIGADVGDPTFLKKIVPGLDAVFHQAALPSVPRSVSMPVESNEQNINATLNLLVAVRDAKVRRFVFASSSSIYGESDSLLKHEALAPNPLSPYALQKYTAERYGQLFFRLYGLSTVSLRYFNVFGPRQAYDSPYSGVIAKFCMSYIRNDSPSVQGDGTQSRDFTYIQNVVSANLLALKASNENVSGRVFNVACGEKVNLLDLLAELSLLSGKTIPPKFEPSRAGDVCHSRADISLARQNLGYTPIVNWRVGLKYTFDWYDRTSQTAPCA